jgi:hypothetical protein
MPFWYHLPATKLEHGNNSQQRLHDPSVRYQLDVAAFDAPAKQLEGSTRPGFDLRRFVGERGELLRSSNAL